MKASERDAGRVHAAGRQAGSGAVDAQHQFIVDAQAHGTGSEQELLLPVVIALATLRTSETVLTANAGYHSEANLSAMTSGVLAPNWNTCSIAGVSCVPAGVLNRPWAMSSTRPSQNRRVIAPRLKSGGALRGMKTPVRCVRAGPVPLPSTPMERLEFRLTVRESSYPPAG